MRSLVALSVSAVIVACAAVRPPAPVQARTLAVTVPARYLLLLAQTGSPGPAANTSNKPAGDGLPDGKGKDVTERVCSTCHAINLFSKQRHTADKWNSIMDDMVSKGMDASDKDIATITDYLVANLAPSPSPAAKPDAPTAPPAPAPAAPAPPPSN